MLAVLFGFTSQETEWIKNGEKSGVYCRVMPRLPFPVKGYIYNKDQREVVGEFWCKEVKTFVIGSLASDNFQEIVNATYEEMIEFFLKPWEIDDPIVKVGYVLLMEEVKLFDKPKTRFDFWAYNPEMEKNLKEKKNYCCYNIKTCEKKPCVTNCYPCWAEYDGSCRKPKLRKIGMGKEFGWTRVEELE